MKNWFFICLLFIAPNHMTAQDTIISKVRIGFSYSNEIFPESWRPSPISATGQPMDGVEIPRSKTIITKALSKYTEKILEYNLKAVYFLKSMKFYDVSYGGTNSTNAVYLTNQGSLSGYTDKYLEQTFHHEFSSILFRNYLRFFDTTAWKEINDPGFIYNDPENGVGAIRNNESSQQLDSFFCNKGVLTQYGASSIENDVNTFAQNLFCPEKDFWNYADHFDRINQKVKFLIAFYNKLSPLYTETYFRKMKTP